MKPRLKSLVSCRMRSCIVTCPVLRASIAVPMWACSSTKMRAQSRPKHGQGAQVGNVSRLGGSVPQTVILLWTINRSSRSATVVLRRNPYTLDTSSTFSEYC